MRNGQFESNHVGKKNFFYNLKQEFEYREWVRYNGEQLDKRTIEPIKKPEKKKIVHLKINELRHTKRISFFFFFLGRGFFFFFRKFAYTHLYMDMCVIPAQGTYTHTQKRRGWVSSVKKKIRFDKEVRTTMTRTRWRCRQRERVWLLR